MTMSDHEPRIRKLEEIFPTFSTKEDMAALRAEIRTDMAELRRDFAEFRADIAGIRTDIHKAIAENANWTHTATVGMFSAFVLGTMGLLFTMWNISKQPVYRDAPASAPIVITLPAPQPLPHPVTE